ncbi:IS200/IS605 family transposase [Candidatus Woesearchaeota archaeon]|nr:IS200/IS605 family transposase [Nanoarchaeota archaeon]MCB9370778.1 IS200/IS605 family transposase [Candidatus Woesearchaeota archaeon]USN43879.1 MAG: IS200/IS605 family transposase [Candidatus Woesearchaeota archaeon]
MRNYKDYSNGRCVGWNEHHVEWCTKYRYKIFISEKYKNFCRILLKEGCKRYGFKHIESEVDLDYIHLILSIPLKMDPILALSKLKGYTSKCLFILMPHLRIVYPRGHLWSPGKFSGSVGHITLEKAKKYVEEHKFM